MPFIKTNGINLYYEERGSGDPLLLIMGITATGSVWEKHVNHWQQSFRCITADNRGVGLSDSPEGPYTTAMMADDFAGLLDALQIKKIRVVGVSMGSTIAQQLALRHPEKVISLVLMCPWARCDNMAKGIFENMVNCKKAFDAEAFTLFIQLLIFSKSSWDNEAMHAGMLEDRKQAALNPPVQTLEALTAQAAACTSHNVHDQLHKISQPVLVIGGREDIFTPEWMASEVAAAIPNAELYLYPQSGHAFHWEQLADFNERIKHWLLIH
jgi:pimeloyl-ACP methyl ester carboxylesterase